MHGAPRQLHEKLNNCHAFVSHLAEDRQAAKNITKDIKKIVNVNSDDDVAPSQHLWCRAAAASSADPSPPDPPIQRLLQFSPVDHGEIGVV